MTFRRIAPVLFLVALAAMSVRLLLTLSDPGSSDGGYADFRDTVHAPAAALLDGVNPYDVEAFRSHEPAVGQWFPIYAPHHLLLAIPLGVLPIETAGVLWWALNVVLLLVVAGFAVSRVSPSWGTGGILLLATAALVSNPGRFNFLTGQATLPIVVGTYLAFTATGPWVAGAGAALALLKPQFGIPVLVMLTVCGRWRVALRGTGLAAALSAPIVITLVVIENGVGGFTRSIADNLDFTLSDEKTAAGLSDLRIDAAGTFGRILGEDLGLMTLAIAVIILGIGAFLLKRWGRVDATGMAIVGLTVVLSLFHLPYDELLLIWPLAALLAVDVGLGRWRWVASAALLIAVFNPLTLVALQSRGISSDFRTVTGVALILAFATVGMGVLRQASTPIRSDTASRLG